MVVESMMRVDTVMRVKSMLSLEGGLIKVDEVLYKRYKTKAGRAKSHRSRILEWGCTGSVSISVPQTSLSRFWR